MEMLIIDVREPKRLILALQGEIPNSRVEMLGYGDFIIEGANQKIVIERKEIKDLFHSLNDGRLWDQMKGIEKNFEGYKKVLLIEGSFWTAKKWMPDITMPRFTGTKASLLYGWDGITLMSTENQSETVDLLKRLSEKVGNGTPEVYTRGLGFAKNDRTPNEEIVDMLRGADMIGEKKAVELLRKFKTLGHIARATVSEISKVAGLTKEESEHVFDVFRHRYTEKKLNKEARDNGRNEAVTEQPMG